MEASDGTVHGDRRGRALRRISGACGLGPWAEELLRRADPAPGARVLDVGCGTGVVTRAAARIVGKRGAVTGLDFNWHSYVAIADAAQSGKRGTHAEREFGLR